MTTWSPTCRDSRDIRGGSESNSDHAFTYGKEWLGTAEHVIRLLSRLPCKETDQHNACPRYFGSAGIWRYFFTGRSRSQTPQCDRPVFSEHPHDSPIAGRKLLSRHVEEPNCLEPVDGLRYAASANFGQREPLRRTLEKQINNFFLGVGLRKSHSVESGNRYSVWL